MLEADQNKKKNSKEVPEIDAKEPSYVSVKIVPCRSTLCRLIGFKRAGCLQSGITILFYVALGAAVKPRSASVRTTHPLTSPHANHSVDPAANTPTNSLEKPCVCVRDGCLRPRCPSLASSTFTRQPPSACKQHGTTRQYPSSQLSQRHRPMKHNREYNFHAGSDFPINEHSSSVHIGQGRANEV